MTTNKTDDDAKAIGQIYFAWGRDGSTIKGSDPYKVGHDAYWSKGPKGKKRAAVLIQVEKCTESGSPYSVPVGWWSPPMPVMDPAKVCRVEHLCPGGLVLFKAKGEA